MTDRTRLRELVWLFLRIGSSGFGGPLVHMAMLETEVVERRRWFAKQEFLDALAVCQMLPGPASTQLGVLVSYLRGGLAGALVGGAAFVLPGFLVMLTLTLLHGRYGAMPALSGIFLGIAPAVIAVIGFSAWRLARTACARVELAALGLLALAVTVWTRLDTVVVLLLTGGLWVAYRAAVDRATAAMTVLPALAVAGPEVYGRLAWLWVKMGALVYGGGYVIIPVVRGEAVERFGWLSDRVFLDGLALGQITPGPIVNLSVFVGYQAGGLLGAMVAALGVFAPAFAVVLAAGPAMMRRRGSPAMRRFLEGVNAGVVGAIVGATVPLARGAIVSPFTAVIAALSVLALWRLRLDTLWLVIGAGALGGFWSLWR